MCDPVFTAWMIQFVRDERNGERPPPRIDSSSLSSTSRTAFSKMPVVTIFPGPTQLIHSVSPGLQGPSFDEMNTSLRGNFSNRAAGLPKLVASTSGGFPAIHCDRSIVS